MLYLLLHLAIYLVESRVRVCVCGDGIGWLRSNSMIGHSIGRECCLGICDLVAWRLEVPFVEPLLSHSETSFIAVCDLEPRTVQSLGVALSVLAGVPLLVASPISH